MTRLELSQPEFAIPLPPRAGSVETPPRASGGLGGVQAEDLEQDAFRASVVNTAFNSVSAASYLNDELENRAEGCGLNCGMNGENRDFCLQGEAFFGASGDVLQQLHGSSGRPSYIQFSSKTYLLFLCTARC